MVGIMNRRCAHMIALLLIMCGTSGCVSTTELYAQYDAADCLLVATKDETGVVNLHEQVSDTHYPWEPAVFFAIDSSELATEQTARLDKSMQVLKQFPTLTVGVQGFTDSSGTTNYNEALAERRVKAVKAYLESNGIAAKRVVLQPIGEVLPRINTNDDIAMAVNRRVELMLLDDDGRPMPVQYAMN